MVCFFLKAVEQQAIKNLAIAEKIGALCEEMKQTIEEASGRRPAVYAFEPLMDLVRV